MAMVLGPSSNSVPSYTTHRPTFNRVGRFFFEIVESPQKLSSRQPLFLSKFSNSVACILIFGFYAHDKRGTYKNGRSAATSKGSRCKNNSVRNECDLRFWAEIIPIGPDTGNADPLRGRPVCCISSTNLSDDLGDLLDNLLGGNGMQAAIVAKFTRFGPKDRTGAALHIGLQGMRQRATPPQKA